MKTITTSEREKQVAIAFAEYVLDENIKGCLQNTCLFFLQSESYQSIPQLEASIPVSKVEKRIEELKNHVGFVYATKDRIDELTKLLEPCQQ